MNNVAYRVEGGKLLISIDISATAVFDAKPSSTGKTRLLASSLGAVALPPIQGHAATVSLNLMLKSAA